MNVKLTLTLFLSVLLLSGCIQDEPLSPYADIETFSLPDDIAASAASFNQTNIFIYVRKGADISAVTPTITISEGATITPGIATVQDFSQEVKYTVVSADSKTIRNYVVQAITVSPYRYDFENWEKLSSYVYETPVEYDDENKRTTPWDSSNRGIALYKAKELLTAADYPVHKTTVSTSGTYAAEMITIKGPGDIFGIMNIPIAAGSLFTGEMNPINALIDPALATRFGQPFHDLPVRFTGKYKYKPGTKDYLNPDGSVNPNMKDSCALYAVFYKADSATMMLDGTNVRSHPNIVLMAMLPGEMRAQSEGDDFVSFDIPFEQKSSHVVDFDRYSYKLSIVLSSSFYGDRYEGVIDSWLVVDDLEILIEE